MINTAKTTAPICRRKRAFTKCMTVRINPHADSIQKCISLMEHFEGKGGTVRQSIALAAIESVLKQASDEVVGL